MPVTAAARGCRGFTLLELLVVVVILAVLSATAVLSIGNLGNDEELEEESARLMRLLQLAEEEAIMDGRDFGLFFEEDRYRFLGYEQEALSWKTLNDDIFRDRQLPEGIWISLVVEDRDVVLELPEGDEDLEPHIVILSSGETTPFVLSIAREFSRQQTFIEGFPDGRLEITEVDPDEF